MVKRSFKSCGISNAMDGTEDYAIYSEDSQELDDNEEMEDEFKTDSEDETDGE